MPRTKVQPPSDPISVSLAGLLSRINKSEINPGTDVHKFLCAASNGVGLLRGNVNGWVPPSILSFGAGGLHRDGSPRPVVNPHLLLAFVKNDPVWLTGLIRLVEANAAPYGVSCTSDQLRVMRDEYKALSMTRQGQNPLHTIAGGARARAYNSVAYDRSILLVGKEVTPTILVRGGTLICLNLGNPNTTKIAVGENCEYSSLYARANYVRPPPVPGHVDSDLSEDADIIDDDDDEISLFGPSEGSISTLTSVRTGEAYRPERPCNRLHEWTRMGAESTSMLVCRMTDAACAYIIAQFFVWGGSPAVRQQANLTVATPSEVPVEMMRSIGALGVDAMPPALGVYVSPMFRCFPRIREWAKSASGLGLESVDIFSESTNDVVGHLEWHVPRRVICVMMNPYLEYGTSILDTYECIQRECGNARVHLGATPQTITDNVRRIIRMCTDMAPARVIARRYAQHMMYCDIEWEHRRREEGNLGGYDITYDECRAGSPWLESEMCEMTDRRAPFSWMHTNTPRFYISRALFRAMVGIEPFVVNTLEDARRPWLYQATALLYCALCVRREYDGAAWTISPIIWQCSLRPGKKRIPVLAPLMNGYRVHGGHKSVQRALIIYGGILAHTGSDDCHTAAWEIGGGVGVTSVAYRSMFSASDLLPTEDAIGMMERYPFLIPLYDGTQFARPSYYTAPRRRMGTLVVFNSPVDAACGIPTPPLRACAHLIQAGTAISTSMACLVWGTGAICDDPLERATLQMGNMYSLTQLMLSDVVCNGMGALPPPTHVRLPADIQWNVVRLNTPNFGDERATISVSRVCASALSCMAQWMAVVMMRADGQMRYATRYATRTVQALIVQVQSSVALVNTQGATKVSLWHEYGGEHVAKLLENSVETEGSGATALLAMNDSITTLLLLATLPLDLLERDGVVGIFDAQLAYMANLYKTGVLTHIFDTLFKLANWGYSHTLILLLCVARSDAVLRRLGRAYRRGIRGQVQLDDMLTHADIAILHFLQAQVLIVCNVPNPTAPLPAPSGTPKRRRARIDPEFIAMTADNMHAMGSILRPSKLGAGLTEDAFYMSLRRRTLVMTWAFIEKCDAHMIHAMRSVWRGPYGNGESLKMRDLPPIGDIEGHTIRVHSSIALQALPFSAPGTWVPVPPNAVVSPIAPLRPPGLMAPVAASTAGSPHNSACGVL